MRGTSGDLITVYDVLLIHHKVAVNDIMTVLPTSFNNLNGKPLLGTPRSIKLGIICIPGSC